MKKIFVFLIAFLIISSVTSAFAWENYHNPDIGYRDRSSYFVNGQRQYVIADQSWGAVVYIPDVKKKMKIKSSLNGTTVETENGIVTISRSQLTDLTITYPDGKFKVEERLNSGSVNFKGKKYRIEVSDLGNKMKVILPDDTITYESTLDKMKIYGKKGTVTYRKELNGYTITSSAGVTKYRSRLNGGFTLEGVPIISHPYGYWGIEFLLEKYKVGVIVEFNRIMNFPSLPRQLMPDKVIVIK